MLIWAVPFWGSAARLRAKASFSGSSSLLRTLILTGVAVVVVAASFRAIGVSLTGLTVRVNYCWVVNSPSLTVRVIVAVPD